MFRDPFIAEAWQLHHQANLVPFHVFLSAAVWLEERYQRSPSAQTARSIAFHYLLLAMRPNLASVHMAEEYAARAVRWRERAGEAFTPEQTLFLQ